MLATPTLPPQPAASVAGQVQNVSGFNRNLSFGMKNNTGVTDLQEFLTNQGYYAGPVTGNFGSLTREAVKKFQEDKGISATGYFGPTTRAAGNEMVQQTKKEICGEKGCAGDIAPRGKLSIQTKSDLRGVVGDYFDASFYVSSGSGIYTITGKGDVPGLSFVYPTSQGCETETEPPPPCLSPPSNYISLSGTPTQSGVYSVVITARDSAMPVQPAVCPEDEPCVKPQFGSYGLQRFTVVIKDKGQTGQAPVINGIKGPTTLKTGEEGIWTVSAYDPQNGKLSYSVVWGDEVVQQVVQTATFSHAYANPGVYAPTFYVTNDLGLTSKTSISVNVSGEMAYQLSLKIIGEKSVYAPEEKIALSVKGVELLDGSAGEPSEGFNVQVYLKGVDEGSVIQGVNATYNAQTGYWDAVLTAPTDASKKYQVEAFFYCADGSLACGKRYAGVDSQVTASFTFILSTSTSPSITVLSPNGGEVWTQGSKQKVIWTSTNVPAESTMIIGLRQHTDSGIKDYDPLGKSPNDGSEEIIIPLDQPPGAYLAYVRTAVGGQEVFDLSDSKFSIVGETSVLSITVLSPNGGETWTKGKAQTIRWKAPSSVSAVNIYLTTWMPPCKTAQPCPAYPSRAYTIASQTKNDGDFVWRVLNVIPAGTYVIQVESQAPYAIDQSDLGFSIVERTATNIPPKITDYPAIPVSVAAGQEVSFTWTAYDADGDNLSWSGSWGDGIGFAGVCPALSPNTKFTASHVWETAGDYKVSVSVYDCKDGTASHNFTMNVGGGVGALSNSNTASILESIKASLDEIERNIRTLPR